MARWDRFGDADYAPPYDDPIYAMHDGIVAYVGYVSGYGNNVIIINAPDIYGIKYSTLLAHGKNVLVKKGDKVSKGQQVATMYKTGTSAIHCHCEVRTQWYDPKTYWNKHYRHGGGEFYSSYDPMNYIVEHDYKYISAYAKESWGNAVKKGLIDAKDHTKDLTIERLMYYFDKLGLL